MKLEELYEGLYDMEWLVCSNPSHVFCRVISCFHDIYLVERYSVMDCIHFKEKLGIQDRNIKFYLLLLEYFFLQSLDQLDCFDHSRKRLSEKLDLPFRVALFFFYFLIGFLSSFCSSIFGV